MNEYQDLMLEQRQRARASSNLLQFCLSPVSLKVRQGSWVIKTMPCKSNVLEMIDSSMGTQSNSLSKDEKASFFWTKLLFTPNQEVKLETEEKLQERTLFSQYLILKKVGDHYGHLGIVEEGVITKSSFANAEIDEDFRQRTMLNHSATHLLQAFLKKSLGYHIEQKGSLVDSNKLRFDFTHPKSISKRKF